MMLTDAIAEQIAELLNAQNRLTVPYTAARILEHQNRYIVRLDDNSDVLGTIEVKKVQWYQCEIDHLSVHPDAKGKESQNNYSRTQKHWASNSVPELPNARSGLAIRKVKGSSLSVDTTRRPRS